MDLSSSDLTLRAGYNKKLSVAHLHFTYSPYNGQFPSPGSESAVCVDSDRHMFISAHATGTEETTQSMREVWTEIKSALKAQIPAHSFRMWIEPVEYIRSEPGTLVLSCPNFFSRKRVQEHYLAMIEAQILKHTDVTRKVVLEIEGKNGNGSSTPVRKSVTVRPPAAVQMDLPEMPGQTNGGRFLRKDFTFDRFVVSPGNNFAYSAALSLASRSGISQNSLFLLSETGLGKSHLSQAIGHQILSQFPGENVYYITAEDFTNEMIRAFRNNGFEAFKEKYRRQCDVLLLEDIHFLNGKERTQVELGLALDNLFDAQKKIIFTSCYLPGDIPKMSEQLRSRLSRSLISSIEPPDYQTRVRILEQMMAENGCMLPREIIQYLATELSENVRQLESGLIGVTARTSLMNCPVDIRLAEDVVQNITRKRRSITVESIKQMVCEHYNVTVADIESRSRKKAIVHPRQMAIYLARKYTDQPLQSIGKSFNRYHATAIHSIAAIEKGLKTDSAVRNQMKYLCKRIEGN